MEKTEKLTLRECLIGDRAFYRHVLVVVLPIIVQNTLTNVVSLLDNVMVGQVGTLPMSGVAVVGQLLFVYNLAVWGSTAGAGIFGAQFYGRGDMEGVRHTFRFKLLVALAITAAAIGLFLAAGPSLIGAYIAADTSPADAAALAECQYMLTKPLCLVCDDAAVLEQALRVYQGRALYEGALPEDLLRPLAGKYGLLY